MIDTGLKDKVVLITGGNNPYGIGAAIARAFASQGANVFIHYFRQAAVVSSEDKKSQELQDPGLEFFFKQQAKTADEVLVSIRDAGGHAESWEGDLREPENVHRLFEQAEKTFGQVDILVNNAAEYIADTFLPSGILKEKTEVWEEGPTTSTIDEASHDRHFAVNSRAVVILMSRFASRIVERHKRWGRIINISADWITGQLLFVHGGHRMALGL